MKTANVTVPWAQGLHLRAAARVVQIARSFRAQVHLRFDSAMADATSVLALLLLSASSGSRLVVQAAGEDEQEAVQALQGFFADLETEEAAESCALGSDPAFLGLQPV